MFSSLWWILGGPPVNPELLWQPGIIALCLFAAQLCQFIALDRGDVSVAVPVFGLKVVIVAWVDAFFDWRSGGRGGCGWRQRCPVVGITFLNRQDSSRPGRSLAVDFHRWWGGFGGVCLFDILVQKWGPQWGAGRLLPMIFWINAVLSLGLVTQFAAPLKAVPKQAWRWLLSGSVLLGLQSVPLRLFFGHLREGDGGECGLLGSRIDQRTACLECPVIGSPTRSAISAARPLFWRLVGALLMLSAIVIVLRS